MTNSRAIRENERDSNCRVLQASLPLEFALTTEQPVLPRPAGAGTVISAPGIHLRLAGVLAASARYADIGFRSMHTPTFFTPRIALSLATLTLIQGDLNSVRII